MSNKSRRNGSGPASRSSRPGGSRQQPQASSARRKLERFSAPLLVTLHNLPRWLVPIGLAVMLFIGLLLSGDWGWLGAVFLILIGVFVTWLTALSWPVLTGSSRLVRLVVCVVLFGLAVLKAMGRW